MEKIYCQPRMNRQELLNMKLTEFASYDNLHNERKMIIRHAAGLMVHLACPEGKYYDKGIRTVKDLYMLNRADITSLYMFGSKTVDGVNEVLGRYGLPPLRSFVCQQKMNRQELLEMRLNDFVRYANLHNERKAITKSAAGLMVHLGSPTGKYYDKGIRTVKDLYTLTSTDIVNLPMFGPKTVDGVNEVLGRYGLQPIKMNLEDSVNAGSYYQFQKSKK